MPTGAWKWKSFSGRHDMKYVWIFVILAAILLVAGLCKTAGDCSREEEKQDGC